MVQEDSKNGVGYTYFEDKGWKFLPVFDKLRPIKRGEVYEFRIGDINRRSHQYGIQFKASLKVDAAGDYRFYLNSDDGSKLYIDGKQVVDNDGGHGTIERSGNIVLEQGRHEITVDYHNQGGGAWRDVYYKGPDMPKQIIPADVLFMP